jgi:ubiquinone/menaquinone biosynthesis C-methylase UbiE
MICMGPFSRASSAHRLRGINPRVRTARRPIAAAIEKYQHGRPALARYWGSLLAEATMSTTAPVPPYLQETYWWAYVHPNAVRLFERQWLVNLILWGNFARLRDGALDAVEGEEGARTLQVACVYGDFTARLEERVTARRGSLDVVDVLPIQLDNLRRKLGACSHTRLLQGDAADLRLEDGGYDRAVLFFLLHEMPAEVRRRALGEVLRVLKPGGRLVIVDYHRPSRWHPLRNLMRWVLRNFEPFALDLWRHDVVEWLPPAARVLSKRTFWGGLYQRVEITR